MRSHSFTPPVADPSSNRRARLRKTMAAVAVVALAGTTFSPPAHAQRGGGGWHGGGGGWHGGGGGWRGGGWGGGWRGGWGGGWRGGWGGWWFPGAVALGAALTYPYY